ncbi:hypothetical protein KC367_g9007 [Hortaea werneckii]|nr:hypothetical protein KC367_g9007 [Hortaea werneckii]
MGDGSWAETTAFDYVEFRRLSGDWGTTTPTEGGQQPASSEPSGTTDQSTNGNEWGKTSGNEAGEVQDGVDAQADAGTAANPGLKFEALTLGKDEFLNGNPAAGRTETIAFDYTEFQRWPTIAPTGLALLRFTSGMTSGVQLLEGHHSKIRERIKKVEKRFRYEQLTDDASIEEMLCRRLRDQAQLLEGHHSKIREGAKNTEKHFGNASDKK